MFPRVNDEWRLPITARLEVEGSGLVAWEERPPNPFAIFGGLGA